MTPYILSDTITTAACNGDDHTVAKIADMIITASHKHQARETIAFLSMVAATDPCSRSQASQVLFVPTCSSFVSALPSGMKKAARADDLDRVAIAECLMHVYCNKCNKP